MAFSFPNRSDAERFDGAGSRRAKPTTRGSGVKSTSR